MSLTDLQKSRIRFHLGYSSEGPAQFSDQLTVDQLKPESELALIGSDLDYEFLGVPLCQVGSLLYNCELAYANLAPSVIDDSMLVSTVGDIQLRANELGRRQELYDYHRERLSQVTNSPILGAQRARRSHYVR